MDIYNTDIYYYDSNGVLHTFETNTLIRSEKFSNAAQINWNGVNGVSALIDDPDGDELTVFSTSGFTPERGLFIDIYKPAAIKE